jgi:hypothetical protein
MSRIRIANSQPGSAKYTSASRAERYVRCKKSVMIDGELHAAAWMAGFDDPALYNPEVET